MSLEVLLCEFPTLCLIEEFEKILARITSDLVTDRLDIRWDISFAEFRELVVVELRMRASLLLYVHLEECLSCDIIWRSEVDFFIEAAWAQYRRIEVVWAIGRGDDDEVRDFFERVEFLEKLAHFLCFIGIDIIGPCRDERVDLVEKEDDGFIFCSFFRGCEEVFYILGRLVEIWWAELSHVFRDESTSELFSELLRDECLSCSWRTIEEHTSGDRDLEFLIFTVESLEECIVFWFLFFVILTLWGSFGKRFSFGEWQSWSIFLFPHLLYEELETKWLDETFRELFFQAIHTSNCFEPKWLSFDASESLYFHFYTWFIRRASCFWWCRSLPWKGEARRGYIRRNSFLCNPL